MIFRRLVPVFARILSVGPVTGASSFRILVIVPANVLRVGWRNLPGMNRLLSAIAMSLMFGPRRWTQIHWRTGTITTGSIMSRPCATADLSNGMGIPGSDGIRSGRRQHWEQMTC
jgi:hypothetical protein